MVYMARLGKFILVLSFCLFCIGLSTLFWEPVDANINGKNELLLKQEGYPVSGKGVASFQGGATKIGLYKYIYVVNGKSYRGIFIRFSVSSLSSIKYKVMESYSEQFKVYYFPLAPTISVAEKGIPILHILILCIFGLGFIALGSWLRKPKKLFG